MAIQALIPYALAAYGDDEISHVGEHTYTGRFGDELIKDK